MEDDYSVIEDLKEYDEKTICECTMLDRIFMYTIAMFIIGAVIGIAYLIKEFNYVA